MFYLAKQTATGKLVNVWAPGSTAPEYKEGQIIGPLPKDANGEYESPEWLTLDQNNNPVIDQVAKNKIKQEKLDHEQKENDRKKARGDLDKIDWSKVTTVDDAVKILKEIVKVIKQ